jgi:phenylacetate-coenzyme A ligase PaaK-like adenylate-forming protein
VRDQYGVSEFVLAAFGCGERWPHVNADWVVLEPVDEHHRPVPPGRTSATVLMTNLAGGVPPIIRYDLGGRALGTAIASPAAGSARSAPRTEPRGLRQPPSKSTDG